MSTSLPFWRAQSSQKPLPRIKLIILKSLYTMPPFFGETYELFYSTFTRKDSIMFIFTEDFISSCCFSLRFSLQFQKQSPATTYLSFRAKNSPSSQNKNSSPRLRQLRSKYSMRLIMVSQGLPRLLQSLVPSISRRNSKNLKSKTKVVRSIGLCYSIQSAHLRRLTVRRSDLSSIKAKKRAPMAFICKVSTGKSMFLRQVNSTSGEQRLHFNVSSRQCVFSNSLSLLCRYLSRQRILRRVQVNIRKTALGSVSLRLHMLSVRETRRCMIFSVEGLAGGKRDPVKWVVF